MSYELKLLRIQHVKNAEQLELRVSKLAEEQKKQAEEQERRAKQLAEEQKKQAEEQQKLAEERSNELKKAVGEQISEFRLISRLVKSSIVVGPTETPASVGARALNALHPGADLIFMGYPGEAAVFSEDDFITASSLPSEELFDVFVTPFLHRLFRPRILVNSEFFCWVQTGGKALKPDFFVVPHVGCYAKRLPKYNSKTTAFIEEVTNNLPADIENDVVFRYGVLADWRLRNNVIVLSSKLRNSATGVGELLIYLHHIFGKEVSKGILFDRKSFQLIVATMDVITSRETSQWTTPGSVRKIQEFFAVSRDRFPDVVI